MIKKLLSLIIAASLISAPISAINFSPFTNFVCDKKFVAGCATGTVLTFAVLIMLKKRSKMLKTAAGRADGNSGVGGGTSMKSMRQ